MHSVTFFRTGAVLLFVVPFSTGNLRANTKLISQWKAAATDTSLVGVGSSLNCGRCVECMVVPGTALCLESDNVCGRNFLDSFREAGPHWQSLPGYFKNQGYTTLGAGKTCVARLCK